MNSVLSCSYNAENVKYSRLILIMLDSLSYWRPETKESCWTYESNDTANILEGLYKKQYGIMANEKISIKI